MPIQMGRRLTSSERCRWGAADDGAVVLMTEAWSHQLGARDAARRAHQAHSLRCFEGNALAPLTDQLASAFRLGNRQKPLRARPAWSQPID